jgi:hypothetical protein
MLCPIKSVAPAPLRGTINLEEVKPTTSSTAPSPAPRLVDAQRPLSDEAQRTREKCVEDHEAKWGALNSLGRKMTVNCLIPGMFGGLSRPQAGGGGARGPGSFDFSNLTDQQRERLERKLTSAECTSAVTASLGVF